MSKKIFTSIENLNFDLKKNDQTVQSGNTSDMLWTVDEIVAHVSKYFTLKTGDLIFTGTPQGVAAVKPGDVLEGFLAQNKLFRLHVK